VSDLSMTTTNGGPNARKVATAIIALVFVLWTLAAVITLVYWSGTVLWVLGAIALVGFIWILRVYLRPSAPDDAPTDT
jgi:hypothetical protein